jgi:hypothetical protein
MKAWESDCKVEKSFTAGTGHVAHSVNDNEEITRTKIIDQAGKEPPATATATNKKGLPKGLTCEQLVHTQRLASP